MKKIKNALKVLELPKEALMNYPLVTLTGKEEAMIENYKGIIEYSEEKVRLNTSVGILRIEGKNLLLKQVTSENILVLGIILKIEYVI